MVNFLEGNCTVFRRQMAAWPSLKIRGADNGKSLGRSGTAWANNGTHTTLTLCVLAVPGNPQKTGIYGPRQIHSGASKAKICDQRPYEGSLESAYFRGLASRPCLSPSPLAER